MQAIQLDCRRKKGKCLLSAVSSGTDQICKVVTAHSAETQAAEQQGSGVVSPLRCLMGGHTGKLLEDRH